MPGRNISGWERGINDALDAWEKKKKTPSESHADSLVLPWQFIIVLTIVRGKLAIDQVYSIYHPPLV